jgi:uncharacterized protein YjbJ (UPF0337 family)
MNKDIFEGKWEQIKGTIVQKWGDLTDDDLTQINGSREKLLGKIQEAYGRSREDAEREIKEWEKTSRV